MSRRARLVVVSLTVVAALAASGAPAAAQSSCADADLRPAPDTLERVEAALVCLTNEERQRRSLLPLTVDPRLDRSAWAHTEDMVTRGYFAHHQRGRPFLYERLSLAGYFKGSYTALYSENLGFGPPEYATAAGLQRAFMSSDAHRRNILYGRFRNIGIGSVVIGPNPAFYENYAAVVYTVDFGRRYVRRARRPAPRCVRRPAGTSEASAPGRAIKPRRYCPRRTRR